ncbi:Protein of unknown function DUF509 [Methanococcoides burtonii DSM 6242]|uniref:KEOPS complex Cgi121-like subunit n=2 Tax=Methanococcoides burtonii TaxID=29291 RepID=Q12WA3_METBU|nr:Protein of unknown function DUF509 [Methanococcoides burtonii DSM 6242]
MVTVILIEGKSNPHIMDIQLIEGSLVIDELQRFLKGLSSIASEHDVIIQGMDAGKIAGKAHIDHAISKAMKAMENGTNIAKDLGVEMMRYASGKKQIGEAFSIGLSEGRLDVVFIIIGAPVNVGEAAKKISSLVELSDVLKYSVSKNEQLISQFSITDAELEAVGEDRIPELVLERVALVDILK